MTQSLAYTCKVCKRPGVAFYDVDCPTLRLESWQAMLCCNSCYDFKLRYDSVADQIVKLCRMLNVTRYSMRKDKKRLGEFGAKMRPRFVDLTRELVSVAADHYRIDGTNLWAPEMVDDIMSKPEGVAKYLKGYHSLVRNEARKVAA